tara:strand:- start:27142 stop:27486 length:345 start_codon:yes stop_codon:yes gene_type:complete
MTTTVNFVFNEDEITKALTGNVKMTPQIKQILQRVVEGGTTQFTEAELKTFIDDIASDGYLVTRQKPWRIWSYYKNDMIGNDYVRQENLSDEKKPSKKKGKGKANTPELVQAAV